MKVILDTNIYIAALLSPAGPPARLIQAWLNDQIIVVACPQLIEEIRQVACRPKLAKRISSDTVDALVRNLYASSAFIDGQLPVIKVSPDTKDDYLLALGQVSAADALITGDKGDLPILSSHGTMRILTARTFLTLLAANSPLPALDC